MKIKVFILSLFFALFGVITLSQLKLITEASALSPRGGGPTEPITPPVITFPTTVRGTITYRFLNYLPIKELPAIGVNVYVSTFQGTPGKMPERGGGGAWTVTDKNGNYVLNWQAQENKTYYVSFWDNKGTIFSPQQYGITFTPKRGGGAVFNAEGKITYFLYLQEINQTFGSKQGEARFNTKYDSDNNGEIDIFDVIRLRTLLLLTVASGRK